MEEAFENKEKIGEDMDEELEDEETNDVMADLGLDDAVEYLEDFEMNDMGDMDDMDDMDDIVIFTGMVILGIA